MEKKQVRLNSAKALAVLESQGGKFISVDIIRRDGVWRTLNGRFGVKKNSNGGDCSSVKPENCNVLFYDVRSGYRTIAIDRLVGFRCDGKEFVLV